MPGTQTKAAVRPDVRLITLGLFSLAALFLSLVPAISDSHQKIIKSHGYNEYQALKYAPDDPHLDYVNPDAPKGGEISISAIGTFDSMNPYATGKGTWGMLSTIGYEDMMVPTSDEVGSMYCLLCETLEYPEDESWVIFHLRRDVTFSDGTPMTAHDILFSHNLLIEQGTPSYANYTRQAVAKAEALDDYTLKFTFTEDFPKKNLITQMGSLPAWSRKWYEETGARLDESRLEIGPGTGPYMVGSLDVGRQIIYQRNPDYWGADHYLMKGRSNFDNIRVEYFGDSSAAFEAFKAGVYTFRRENSSLNWATLYDFPALDNGWVKKESLADGTLPGATGFVFNMMREKFADRNVRLALGQMFNFEWTNTNLQYGLFKHRQSFWENDRLRATGIPRAMSLPFWNRCATVLTRPSSPKNPISNPPAATGRWTGEPAPRPGPDGTGRVHAGRRRAFARCRWPDAGCGIPGRHAKLRPHPSALYREPEGAWRQHHLQPDRPQPVSEPAPDQRLRHDVRRL